MMLRTAIGVMTGVFALAGTSVVMSLRHQATELAPVSARYDDGGPVDSGVADGSTVRGQLFRRDRSRNGYPAQGIAVRLNHRQYGPSVFVNTDSAGMYYLYRIPNGDFALEVWLTQRPQDMRSYWIQVRGQPFTDIDPIEVP